MNQGPETIDGELVDRIAHHEASPWSAVADVVESGADVTLIADGRASDLRDFNHASLIRTSPGGFDNLLARVTRFYEKRDRTPALLLDTVARPVDPSPRGWAREGAPTDLMLWNPDSRHIFTAGEAYMTLATNATLDAWLDIFTSDLVEPLREQARTMWAQMYRVPGLTLWFGLYNGIPAGACPLFVRDGLGACGPLHTAPEYRGKGVGLALFNYVTRQSRKDGANVTYALNEHDGPATGICRTTGYQTVIEDALQMWVRRG